MVGVTVRGRSKSNSVEPSAGAAAASISTAAGTPNRLAGIVGEGVASEPPGAGATVRGSSKEDGGLSSVGALVSVAEAVVGEGAVPSTPTAAGVPERFGGIVGEGVGSDVDVCPPPAVGETGAGAAVLGRSKEEIDLSSIGAVVYVVEAVVGEGVGSSPVDAEGELLPGPVILRARGRVKGDWLLIRCLPYSFEQ